MTRPFKRIWLMSMLFTFMWVGMGDALASDTDEPERKMKRGAWQPGEEDRDAFRDIVDFNIFRADRKRLADQVDRDRNPPEPRDPGDDRRVPVVDDTPPPDPDSFWRLTGITHAGTGTIAFFENTKSGELSRIARATEFSLGEITTIGYDKIVYVVQDEQRVIQIGETLLGVRASPGASSSGTSTTSRSKDKPSSGSVEDRLRALRERRAQEQGEGSTPEPTPDPAAPESDEQTTPAPSPAAPDNTTSTITASSREAASETAESN